MKNTKHFHNPRGNILFSLLFVLLASVVGLALISSTTRHQQVLNARQRRSHHLYHLRCKLDSETHRTLSAIRTFDFSTTSSPESDFFCTSFFPDRKEDNVLMGHNFKKNTTSYDSWQKIRFQQTITAEYRPFKAEALLISDLVQGRVPLHVMPVAVNTRISGSAAEYLAANNISLPARSRPSISEMEVDFSVSRLIMHGLNLSGESLSWSQIREKAGLPADDIPVPEGIYLVKENDEILAVLVQGDLDRLCFQESAKNQTISFEINGSVYHLEYTPGSNYFSCWQPDLGFDRFFREQIFVNGHCLAVENPAVESVPAFHDQADILLLVTGECVIKTSLKKKNFSLRHETPPGLTLVGSGTDDWAGPEKSSVTIDAPATVDMDAAVFTTGIFTSNAKKLNLHGSLYTHGIKNQGQISTRFNMSGRNLNKYLAVNNFRALITSFVSYLREVFP